MHKYSSGHRTQILAQLAAVFVVAALFASVVLYVVTNPGSSSVVLALVISALVLFSLASLYIRMGRQKNEHLRYHALHNSLTDLPNRSLCVDRVDQALTQADGSSASIAIMFVDLDDFKDINHSYGYETGDKLLVAVAERLLQPSRTTRWVGSAETSLPSCSKTSHKLCGRRGRSIEQAVRSTVHPGGRRDAPQRQRGYYLEQRLRYQYPRKPAA